MGLSCLTGATTSQKSSPSAVSRQKQNFHFLIIQFCMGCPSLMIRVFSLSKSLSPSYELMKCVQVALGPCCLPNRLPWDQVEDGSHCGTKTIAGLSSPANILIHEVQDLKISLVLRLGWRSQSRDLTSSSTFSTFSSRSGL